MLTVDSAATRRSVSMRRKLLLTLLVCSLLSFGYVSRRRPSSSFRLLLEMSSSTPSIAKLFYDTGTGYQEENSSVATVGSKSLQDFRVLTFILPNKAVSNLRFDPLTTAGSFVIRNIRIQDGNRILLPISPASVRPFNQISSCVPSANEVAAATTPGADDPGVTFTLAKPLTLRPHWKAREWEVFVTVDFVLCLIAMVFVPTWFRRRLAVLDARLGRLAARLSAEEFIRFDSLALWVYSISAIAFPVAGSLNLNGSSAGMYNLLLGRGGHARVLVGKPRSIRSDEWAYQTPDVLNQAARVDRFQLEDSVLGNHAVSLLGNVPVRHVTTIFRPQFWSFFVLPVSYAFAFYWQAKALLLFIGVFTFLLWLTQSSFWALTGALWFFFAPFTQWTYSWPSALPEMIGSICLASVFFAYLLVGRNTLALSLSALGAAAFSINFAMCGYPPHMIPLAWVAIAVFAGWAVSAYRRMLVREKAWIRLVALCAALAICIAVGWRTYEDLRLAITTVANTVYPGQRLTTAGTISPWEFVIHLTQWRWTESHFPAVLGNICEGSGYFWLAPMTLLCLPRTRLQASEKGALIGLWFVSILLLAWLVMPAATPFGQFLGLNRTWGQRLFPALGLANVSIVAITMTAVLRSRGEPLWRFKGSFKVSIADGLAFVAGMVILIALLVEANAKMSGLSSQKEIFAAGCVSAGYLVCMLSGRQLLLAIGLVVPEIVLFGAINPIERGLPTFLQSDLHEFIEQHPVVLSGEWLIYSKSPLTTGLFSALGCQVYTGTRYLPDVDHFRLLAANGLDLNSFNRLGYLDAVPLPSGQTSYAVLESPVVIRWNVAPDDQILRQIGIRYMAFDSEPPADETRLLKPLSARPVDGFWLYQVAVMDSQQQ